MKLFDIPEQAFAPRKLSTDDLDALFEQDVESEVIAQRNKFSAIAKIDFTNVETSPELLELADLFDDVSAFASQKQKARLISALICKDSKAFQISDFEIHKELKRRAEIKVETQEEF